MTALTVNSDQSLSRAIGDLREAYRAHRYVKVTIGTGAKRSLDQNALSHAWYQQIADELREYKPHEIKRANKLHHGVPILRAEDEEFRAVYDAVIRPLAYEQKLLAMDILPVTSRMTKAQLSAYLDAMKAAYDGSVALQFPDEIAA